jgi:hypothetical protein
MYICKVLKVIENEVKRREKLTFIRKIIAKILIKTLFITWFFVHKKCSSPIKHKYRAKIRKNSILFEKKLSHLDADTGLFTKKE